MGKVLICCIRSYPDKAEREGWTKALFPDSKTKRLSGLDIPVPNKK
ncbi:MAG: hypothetical protein WB706_03580 [Nitrososphaeraceae archaeon]